METGRRGRVLKKEQTKSFFIFSQFGRKLLLLCFSLRRCEQGEKNTFIMSEMAHIIPDPEHQTTQLILKPPIE